jgi:hypothetical protein
MGDDGYESVLEGECVHAVASLKIGMAARGMMMSMKSKACSERAGNTCLVTSHRWRHADGSKI